MLILGLSVTQQKMPETVLGNSGVWLGAASDKELSTSEAQGQSVYILQS